MKPTIALSCIVCLVAPLFAADAPTGQQPAKHFKIIQTASPVYPVSMSYIGVRHGEVRIVLHVNPQGQLDDYLLVAYSRNAFAEEAVRVVQKWKFEPEYSGSEPIGTVVDITFQFQVDGVMLVTKNTTDVPFVESISNNSYEYQICTLKKLDGIPTPVSIESPVYPKEWIDQGIVGKVTVSFYIDEMGKVRFPATPAGANEKLAGIAIAAVKKWQFAPPTCKGKPVLVYAQQIFDFH